MRWFNNNKIIEERKCLSCSFIFLSLIRIRVTVNCREGYSYFFLLCKKSSSIAEGWIKTEFHFYHYAILLLFTLHLKFLFERNIALKTILDFRCFTKVEMKIVFLMRKKKTSFPEFAFQVRWTNLYENIIVNKSSISTSWIINCKIILVSM